MIHLPINSSIMKTPIDEAERKAKHRRVERVRHHKLQSLINQLCEEVPSENGQVTQCSVLKKSAEYISFLINEINRITAIIEVDGYSSSQATVTSSQGNLIIDLKEQFTNSLPFDSNQREEEDNNKYPPLPSSLLSPDQEYFEFSPPVTVPSTKWIETNFDYHSPYPSPPPTSNSPPPLPLTQLPPLPLTQQLPQPQYDQVDQRIYHPVQIYSPHCSTCNCYPANYINSRAPINTKSFGPSDHLLTETIQDNYIDSNPSWV